MILFAILSMIFPLLGLVLIGWAIVTVVRAVTLPRTAARVPACERCKFPAGDLPSFTCPECGADLRAVGIITPAMEIARRGSLATAILAWTFLFGTLAYAVVFIGFFVVGAMGAMSSVNTTSTWSVALTPSSRNYRAVELVYDSDWVSVASEIEITMTLNDGSAHWIKLDPGPMQVRGIEAEPVPWETGRIRTWLTDLGLDTTDPQLAAEADEIARFVDLTVMAPTSAASNTSLRHHTPMMSQSGTTALGPGGFAPWGGTSIAGEITALIVALILYAFGVFFIVARRRRMLRAA